MPIEDVFSIKGRGTVGTGRIERGKVKVGDAVEIVGLKPIPSSTVITGIEQFQKTLDGRHRRRKRGRAASRAWKRKSWNAARCLRLPRASPRTPKFEAEVYILTKEEGGRHTPFFNGYRPQFYFRTTDVTGSHQAARRGGNGDARRQRDHRGELNRPIAMEEKLRFAIREGGRTVGSGVVTKIRGK